MANITVPNISLEKYDLTERVKGLRDAYFKAMPEICIERPQRLTDFHRQNGLFNNDSVTILEKAKAYRNFLQNRSLQIWHETARDKNCEAFPIDQFSLFAGSTTSKFKGVPIYQEMMGLSLWPELETISHRSKNPNYLSTDDARTLNEDVFPYWLDNTILELARKNYQPWDPPRSDDNGPDFQLLQYMVFFLASKPECISHTIPDFTQAINRGLDDIIREACEKGADTSLNNAQKEFFQAIEVVLRGIVEYSERLSDEAARMISKTSDPIRKRELIALADIHKQVPRNPARTFREGLTTVWICWTALHLENANVGLSLGRLDQILYDLYRNDIDNGDLTIEEAIELISCLWLKIGDHVPFIPEAGEQLFGGTGSNQAITIGGVDEEGNDAVNDLTYVMLRATELMLLRDPNLNARYHSRVNTPEYLERISEANLNTRATPAIHNDKVIMDALMKKGETLKQARDYGIIGCVEPGSNGRHYGMSAALLVNLVSALELTLGNGTHRHTGDQMISVRTGELTSFETFEDFKTAFETQVRWLAEQGVRINNALGETHQRYYPTPILSALFEGPMDNKKDVIQGGAVINSSGVAIIGLADVTDCLTAIQKEVFEKKTIPFEALLTAVNNNFEGDEALRSRLMNPEKTPKFGNEGEAQANADWLVKLLDETFGNHMNYRGATYRVGYWTMTNHAGFGRLTRATPNGRRDGENFASGITPVSGVTPYLTPALNSVASLPGAERISSGMAFNIKYTPNPGKPMEMVKAFADTVEGYFDGNGMEIQFNITNRETFEDAVRHPGNHSELLVRVSGYTAYFIDLNPQMQKEIIDRTEYDLLTQQAQDYPPYPLPPS